MKRWQRWSVAALCLALIFMLSVRISYDTAPVEEAHRLGGRIPVTLLSHDIPSPLMESLTGRMMPMLMEDTALESLSYPTHLYYHTLRSRFSTDSGSSIVMIDHPEAIGTLVPESALIPLDGYFDSNWRQHLEITTTPTLYTPPLGMKYYLLYCNQDWLDELNLYDPSPTVNELVSTLNSLVATGSEPIAFGLRDWLCLRNALVPLSFARGEADPFDSAWSHFQMLLPYLKKDAVNYDYEDAKLLFKQGECAFFFGNSLELEELREGCDFTVSPIHLRAGGGIQIWYDYVGMYAVNASSVHRAETLAVVRALASEEILEEYRQLTKPSAVFTEFGSAGYTYTPNWLYSSGGAHIVEYLDRIEALQEELFRGMEG